MASISNLAATTELDAVNSMLSAIGEAPLETQDDVDNATQADVAMAVNLLREVTREVASMRWRFNLEFGLELAPADTLAWTDTAGNSVTLNIFLPPAGLIAFTPKAGPNNGLIPDVVIRKSKVYQDATPALVEVFYDRFYNRDGLDSTSYPYLYIDAVWLMDFEDLPETARKFITKRAGRMFTQQAVGSETLAGFTQNDELMALRNLKRDQGQNDNYNMLHSSAVRTGLGGRFPRGLLSDGRSTRGMA